MSKVSKDQIQDYSITPGQREVPLGINLTDNWLRAAKIGWVIIAVVVLVILVTSLPGYIQWANAGIPGHGPAPKPSQGNMVLQTVNTITSLVSAILSYSLSVLLFRHKFENPAVAAISFYLLLYGVVMTGPLEAWGFYWFGSSDFVITVQTILMATPTVALLVLFPNGRFVKNWTKKVLFASIPWSVIAVFIPLIPYQENAVGVLFLGISWVILLGLGIYAQIYRYRHESTQDERRQTRWVLFGFVLWIGYILISTYPYFYLSSLAPGTPQPWWSQLSEFGWWLSLNIVPVTLAIAITRSRLWNIDIVINRTLVFGALTFITMALYIFSVGMLGNLLNVGDSTFIAFLTTGLVAILFQPLRNRLQQGVNRLMYGERDDPVAVLRKLGAELEHTGSPESALDSIVETVARTLKLPYVAIELGADQEVVTSFGIPKDEVTRLPLTYQSISLGNLLVAPRAPGEAFSPSDLTLLENITHQAGAAAHAVKLTADLRHSRQRLVTAREEERRRLRRDLHDGLGPTLASLTLKMDATRNVLQNDTKKAEQLLEELKKQTQGTIQDIRDLVYELRPPALDEFGLVGAIQNFIENQTATRPRFSMEIPEPLPPLPAAYEVAIYRIALEGLTNIIRHADAQTAKVRISLINDQLVLEVLDDGVGLPDGQTNGVGLTSMRERAEELGGFFEIKSLVPGSQIRVILPRTEA
jgi:signal transduction histidine kinase